MCHEFLEKGNLVRRHEIIFQLLTHPGFVRIADPDCSSTPPAVQNPRETKESDNHWKTLLVAPQWLQAAS